VKHAGFNIEIGRVETESFADPRSGHGDQAEERRAGQTTYAVDRWQRPRMLDDRNDFDCTLNIWMHTLNATGHQSRGEPQHMINRARAEATLPQKIGFEIAQQFVTFGLRRRNRWSCRHSDLNETRNEQPGRIGSLDLALRRDRQPPSQFDSGARRRRSSRRRANGRSLEAGSDNFSGSRACSFSKKDTFLERCEVGVEAGSPIGYFHFLCSMLLEQQSSRPRLTFD
jgi:hypothetical protein